jgi:omega-hydroxy-beta-dihydromenaquinone-9 sulfotransferase
METRQATTKVTSVGGYKDRPWYFRFWNGMPWSAWIPLMVRNRCQVGPRRIGMVFLMVTSATVNSVYGLLQGLFLGRRIARTSIDKHPIFIIGHWRTGTTMLHELLVLDPRHTFPDNYACFAPAHFLFSRSFLAPMIRRLFPNQRPMDNMAMTWDRPQEDEFAMCNLGARSPYLTMAFPNRPPQDQEYLTLENVPPAALAAWKRTFLWFLKCVTVRQPKRIVLKSPPHTCRIRVLLELFPDARFVHIVRDPFVVFPSTVTLWKRLYKDEGFQTPRNEGLDEHVFSTLLRMYEAYERDRALVPPRRLCEVRYEDLVADPVGQLRRVYDELELGEFDAVLPALKQYAEDRSDYKRNRYEIAPELRDEISRRWNSYIARYGYGPAAGQDAA